MNIFVYFRLCFNLFKIYKQNLKTNILIFFNLSSMTYTTARTRIMASGYGEEI